MKTQHERIHFKIQYFYTLSDYDRTRILQGFENNNRLVNNIRYQEMRK